jgi:NADH-quinone oxidoreductase subunit L
MIVRCGTLFVSNERAMLTIACIGAFTAILAATIALRQFDLKKVFAYSTISQLGFMFVGVGCLAPVAGIFHLVTHAFFKALLFLCSGVVMHAMGGELDMRKMSGLKKVLPWTNILILIGCLALSGFPFFSGFFSKDEIVAAAFTRGPFIGCVMLFTAFLTAYYTFRLYFRVFQGPLVLPQTAHVHAHDDHGHDPHHEHEHHNPEPMLMIFPLIVLAIGALFAGYLNFPGNQLGKFLGQSPSLSASYEMGKQVYASGTMLNAESMGQIEQKAAPPGPLFSGLMIISGLISIAGVALAYVMHLKDRVRGERIAEDLAPISRLLEHKYWVDEIYQSLIVDPLWFAGESAYRFDKWIVDLLVNMVGWICQLTGYFVKFTTQRGYLQGYAAAMLLGLAAILLLVFIR